MAKPEYPYQDLNLQDMKGEVWDDIPSLDGAYEISNFGRVKSRRRFVEMYNGGGFWTKEKILKPRKSVRFVSKGKRKLYRLTVAISFEGKKYIIGVVRMVHYLFVKKFDLDDRKIKVRTKDEDPFHIEPENLYLTSTDVYMKKAYELSRRKRESFGKKGISVNQYDLEGKWLKNHPSVNVAAQSAGIFANHITASIDRSEGVASGFIWKFGNEKNNLSEIPGRIEKKIASQTFHSTQVTRYDMEGNKIKEYTNVKAAARSLGVQPNLIRRAIIGRSISVKDHYWILGSGPQKISMAPVQKKILATKIKIIKPVTQYGLDGERVQTYQSIAEAARATGLSDMNISGVLRSKKQRTAGGFLWMYGKGAKKIKIDYTIRRKRELLQMYIQPVTQYSLKGVRLAVHDSIKKAADKLRISPSFLADSIVGRSMSYAGFYWQLGKGPLKITQMPRAGAELKRLKKISKAVIQYNLSGKKLKEFPSIGEASRETGTSHNQIRMVAIGKYSAAKGSVWKFK